MAETLRKNAEPPRFTYGDYVKWQGDERWELIGGEVYLMSPAPSRAHQAILAQLTFQAQSYFDDKPCQVYFAPFDVRFPESAEPDDEIDTVLQPDLVVICDADKLDDAGARGAPDWVVEILSPSTTGRDRVAKRAVYERHGVREYWVVDPTSRVVIVHELRNGAFRVREQAGEGTWGPAIFPELQIRWQRVYESV